MESGASAPTASEIGERRYNRLEDIHVAEDGHQIITSTTGHLVSAKNISAGVRSMHYLGQLSDASIPGLFQFRNQGSE